MHNKGIFIARPYSLGFRSKYCIICVTLIKTVFDLVFFIKFLKACCMIKCTVEGTAFQSKKKIYAIFGSTGERSEAFITNYYNQTMQCALSNSFLFFNNNTCWSSTRSLFSIRKPNIKPDLYILLVAKEKNVTDLY